MDGSPNPDSTVTLAEFAAQTDIIRQLEEKEREAMRHLEKIEWEAKLDAIKKQKREWQAQHQHRVIDMTDEQSDEATKIKDEHGNEEGQNGHGPSVDTTDEMRHGSQPYQDPRQYQFHANQQNPAANFAHYGHAGAMQHPPRAQGMPERGHTFGQFHAGGHQAEQSYDRGFPAGTGHGQHYIGGLPNPNYGPHPPVANTPPPLQYGAPAWQGHQMGGNTAYNMPRQAHLPTPEAETQPRAQAHFQQHQYSWGNQHPTPYNAPGGNAGFAATTSGTTTSTAPSSREEQGEAQQVVAAKTGAEQGRRKHCYDHHSHYPTLIMKPDGKGYWELRCCFCGGNMTRGMSKGKKNGPLSGILGFATHLRQCHPDKLPNGGKCDWETILTMCKSREFTNEEVINMRNGESGAPRIELTPGAAAHPESRVNPSRLNMHENKAKKKRLKAEDSVEVRPRRMRSAAAASQKKKRKKLQSDYQPEEPDEDSDYQPNDDDPPHKGKKVRKTSVEEDADGDE